MPPWKPEQGFGDFAGERRLSDAQLETIVRWVAGDRLEGERSDLPRAPRPSSGWQRGAPDLVVTLPEYTLRADGADVFRNFVVTVPGSGSATCAHGIPPGQPRRAPRQHSRRPDASVAAAGRSGSRTRIRRRDSAFRRLSGRSFPWLDAGTGATPRLERPRLAPRRRRGSGGAAAPAADGQAGARPAVDRPLFFGTAARANAGHPAARAPEPRHSSRRATTA